MLDLGAAELPHPLPEEAVVHVELLDVRDVAEAGAVDADPTMSVVRIARCRMTSGPPTGVDA